MHRDDWGNWEPWHQLSSLDWTLPDLKSSGSYMIATNSLISRLKGSDNHGILTIGKASMLKTRIWTFWYGVMKNAESSTIVAGHMAGVRYQTYGLREQFPLSMLHVSWIALPDADAAAGEEASQVDEYIRQHLEPPPLNYCVPRTRSFR